MARSARISPEAPAPVIAVKRSEMVIGGAGNVARNIASLGARCLFVGLVGEDDAGRTLKARSRPSPASRRNWWSTARAQTTRKVRFVSEHYATHMLRADWEAGARRSMPESRRRCSTRCCGRCRASARWCCPTTPRAC